MKLFIMQSSPTSRHFPRKGKFKGKFAPLLSKVQSHEDVSLA